jgi:Arc/MetJ-type ribon-helix-helix transcriptional regulator
MARLTFRADDELIRQLEEMDASQSEVIRSALRSYISKGKIRDENDKTKISKVSSRPRSRRPNVNINIELDGYEISLPSIPDSDASSRCACKNELDESWDFCPRCGRRTKAQTL